MFTTVDLASGDTTVICQLTDRAGRVITVGSFRVTGGDGYWGSPEPDQPSAITSARLITTGGTVLATATFGVSGGGRQARQAAFTALHTARPSMIVAVNRCTHTIGITFRLLAPTAMARAASSHSARTAPIPTDTGLP